MVLTPSAAEVTSSTHDRIEALELTVEVALEALRALNATCGAR